MQNAKFEHAIDHSVIDDYRDVAGDAFVADLVTTFLRESAMVMAALDSALRGGQADAARVAAHTLRGSSATIGARTLSAICGEIEALCREGAMDRATRLAEAVWGEYRCVERELRQLSQPADDALN